MGVSNIKEEDYFEQEDTILMNMLTWIDWDWLLEVLFEESGATVRLNCREICG